MRVLQEKGNSMVSKCVLAIIILSLVLPMTTFKAYGGVEAGTVGTTKFDTVLIGSDGLEYWVKGQSQNIFYNEEGGMVYQDPIDTNLRMGYFQVIDPSNIVHNAFCVEWGVSIYPGTSYNSTEPETDFYFAKLIFTIREGISLATLYGYQQGRPVPTAVAGANEDDWYFATQTIIWEYQQRLRESPTKIQGRSGMPVDYFSKSLEGRPAKGCYDYILTKMSTHYTTPSFAGLEPHVMKYNPITDDYRVTLVDENKAPIPKFSNEKVNMEVDGNKYTFISKEPIEQVALEAQHNIDLPQGYNLIWGAKETGQVLMTGTKDNFYYTISLRTERDGMCTIVKTSDDGKINQVSFQIVDQNNQVTTVNTDEMGISNVSLKPGQYIVKEVERPEYESLEPKVITITEGETIKVTFHNKLVKVEQPTPKEETPSEPEVTPLEPTKGEVAMEKPLNPIVPKTGDPIQYMFFIGIMAVTLLVATMTFVKAKK